MEDYLSLLTSENGDTFSPTESTYSEKSDRLLYVPTKKEEM
jgi:hypothetical protein